MKNFTKKKYIFYNTPLTLSHISPILLAYSNFVVSSSIINILLYTIPHLPIFPNTEKSIHNLINSFSNLFGTANGQRPFAVLNQSENGKYNLISVWFNKISKIFLCVYCYLRTLVKHITYGYIIYIYITYGYIYTLHMDI